MIPALEPLASRCIDAAMQHAFPGAIG